MCAISISRGTANIIYYIKLFNKDRPNPLHFSPVQSNGFVHTILFLLLLSLPANRLYFFIHILANCNVLIWTRAREIAKKRSYYFKYGCSYMLHITNLMYENRKQQNVLMCDTKKEANSKVDFLFYFALLF